MRVLLINPLIRENEPPRHPPFGLGVIANVLLRKGHEVEVLDINAERLSQIQVLERIRGLKEYDIIGTGGLVTTYKYLKWLIPELKKYKPNSKIVIGGGVVTSIPNLLLSRTPADIAVIGEGEETMVDLAFSMPLNQIRGILYKERDQIHQTLPRPLIKNLDSLPFPAWDLFPMKIYLSNVAHAFIIGKKTEFSFTSCRGCPFNCNYCYHVFGRGCRTCSIEKVIEELERLKQKYDMESILFLDETFMPNRERIMEFCDLYKRKIKIPWSCLTRVNLADKGMFRKMKEAGCYRVGYGIESGSQRILDNMNKGVTVEQARKAIKLARECGLFCNTTFMFGYPGENLDTIKETYRFCRGLLIKPHLFYTVPYPGTVLYEQIRSKIKERFNSEEEFIEKLGDVDDFVINLTNFSDNELFKLKEETEMKLKRLPFYMYPKLLFNLYRQIGLWCTIKLVIRYTKEIFVKQD